MVSVTPTLKVTAELSICVSVQSDVPLVMSRRKCAMAFCKASLIPSHVMCSIMSLASMLPQIGATSFVIDRLS